jgi:hypothetical protein
VSIWMRQQFSRGLVYFCFLFNTIFLFMQYFLLFLLMLFYLLFEVVVAFSLLDRPFPVSHQECILQWRLAQSHNHTILMCPVCRSPWDGTAVEPRFASHSPHPLPLPQTLRGPAAKATTVKSDGSRKRKTPEPPESPHAAVHLHMVAELLFSTPTESPAATPPADLPDSQSLLRLSREAVSGNGVENRRLKKRRHVIRSRSHSHHRS